MHILQSMIQQAPYIADLHYLKQMSLSPYILNESSVGFHYMPCSEHFVLKLIAH